MFIILQRLFHITDGKSIVFVYLLFRKMIGQKLNRLFILRCMLMLYPLLTITTVGVISTIFISFIIRIIEGPLYFLKQFKALNIDFNKYNNSIWNILVTMTTGILLI